MSAATINVNPKLPDGTLVSIGGVGYDDFYANAVAMLGLAGAEKVLAGIKAHVAGTPQQNAPAQPQQFEHTPQSFEQAQNVVQGAFGQSQQLNESRAPQGGPPGGAPIGENGRPKRWVPAGVSKKTGKPYDGFWGEDRQQ